MVGTLIRNRREARGLTQTELAERAGLRQTYISQVEKGEIRLPREHNLDAIGQVLDIERGEFYRAAGMLEGLNSGEATTPQDTPPREDEDYDPEEIVRYVESRPGRGFQQRLGQQRARLRREDYVRFCVGLFRAWASNSNLALTSVEIGPQSPQDNTPPSA